MLRGRGELAADERLMVRGGPPIEHEKEWGMRCGGQGDTEGVQAQGTICVMVAKSPDDEPGPTDVERTLD